MISSADKVFLADVLLTPAISSTKLLRPNRLLDDGLTAIIYIPPSMADCRLIRPHHNNLKS